MATYSAQSGDQLGQLGRSRPQLEFDVRQHQRRQIYGRPLQKLSSAASHFLSYQPYDVVFTSLRLVVFQIDPTSATPVAHIIRHELNDGDVFELIKGLDLHTRTSRLREKGGTPATTETSILGNQAARYDLLRDKMDEARAKHAEALRDNGMVDVDIVYKCAKYEIEPFKSDKEIMEAKGGRPYHMYPFREREQEMALSVLVKPETLDMVYPPERCTELNISIKTNTAPAVYATSVVELPVEAGPDTIFPRWEPGSVTESPEKAMERTMSNLCIRGRSDSVMKVVKAPQVSMWRPFRTALEQTRLAAAQEKRNWTAASAPFLNHPGVEENEWLQKDLAEHERNVKQWETETWKMCKKKGVYHRHMTSKDPSVSVAGDDYPVKQPMCETFTEDRNMKQWNEHCANAERKEYQDDYRTYMNLLADAERFYVRLAQLLDETIQIPQSREAKLMLHDAGNNRALVQQNLNKARQKTIASGERRKLRPQECHLAMPEDLEAKWQQQVNAIGLQQAIARQHQPVRAIHPQRDDAAQQQQQRAALAAAPVTGDTPRPEPVVPIRDVTNLRRPDVPDSAAANKPARHRQLPPAHLQPKAPALKKTDSVLRDTMPFPDYQDPLDLPLSAEITDRRAANLPHGGRTPNAAMRRRSQAHTLNTASLMRQVTFHLPQAEDIELPLGLGDPQSPVTPDDWSGTTEGMEDEAATPGRAACVAQGREPAIAGDDSVPASLVAGTQRR